MCTAKHSIVVKASCCIYCATAANYESNNVCQSSSHQDVRQALAAFTWSTVRNQESQRTLTRLESLAVGAVQLARLLSLRSLCERCLLA